MKYDIYKNKVENLYQMAGAKGLYYLGKDFLSLQTFPEQVNSKPRSIQIEVTSICNIKCKMCYINELGKYRADHMKFETFKKIIDENFNHWHLIRMWGIGDPFTNPDIMKMIAYEKELGNAVNLSSNLMLLNEDKVKELVRLKVDRLNISIDGATAETYESIRRGAKFDKLLENLALLKKYNNGVINLCVVSVSMKENLHELKDLVRLVKRFGIKRLFIQEVQVGKDGQDESIINDDSSLKFVDDANKVLEEAVALGKGIGVKVVAPKVYARDKRTECVWPWLQTYVTYNGLVTPCCRNIYEKHYVCGDLNNENLSDIWNNKKYHNFRKQLFKGPLPEQCKDCTML